MSLFDDERNAQPVAAGCRTLAACLGIGVPAVEGASECSTIRVRHFFCSQLKDLGQSELAVRG